jgi:hypothetical protein
MPGENMTQHNFRMKQTEWERLEVYFQDKELSIGGRLIMVILYYIRNKGMM